MPASSAKLPDDLQQLLPLTPAVFFVLFALSRGEKHGYAVMQEVAILSDGKFKMGPATLYTTIQRLLDLCLIEEIEGEENSRRRYYRLARAGKLVFQAEVSRMDALVRLAARNKPLASEVS
jgi:DNA-binding PadR family transcriptional regulator